MFAAFAAFLVVHGLIHLLGFLKAFGIAELPQLTQPVSPAMGVLWLACCVLFVAAACALFLWPRWWWAIGAAAVVISFVAIVPSWSDAKVGAAADLVAAAGVVFGFLALGPTSLRARYENDVDRALARFVEPGAVVADADLRALPEGMQRYLRYVGVVDRPRVRNLRARMHGRIRSGPEGRWMPFRAEQYNFYDEPARFFYLNASMRGVPVQGYHRYAGSEATMRVKAAGVVTVASAAGEAMSQAETVTLFNDMCLFAPATIVEADVRWDVLDARRVRATFTNAGHAIRADLAFDDADRLVNFWSDDRGELSADGRTLTPARWSTPVANYHVFGPVRLASHGEARYPRPTGEFAYLELEIDDVVYNVSHR